MHEQRFFLSNNMIDPKIYQVTKITDLTPQGIIKISIKQDELNEKRDNVELGICDYYTNSGNAQPEPLSEINYINEKSIIHWMYINENDELDFLTDINQQTIQIGKASYFYAEFPSNIDVTEWRLKLIDDTIEDKEYYEQLIKLNKYDDFTLYLKPGKAKSLIGKRFELSVSGFNGEYRSSIILEVTE